MKRSRTIIGIASEKPMPCQACGKMNTVFERVDVEGKVVLICSECMDWVIEEVQKRLEKEDAKYCGDPDY